MRYSVCAGAFHDTIRVCSASCKTFTSFMTSVLYCLIVVTREVWLSSTKYI